MQVSLEKAYEAKLAADGSLAESQGKLDSLTSQVAQANQDRDAAKQSVDRAAATLASVSGSIPPGKVAQTRDGKVLLSFGGQLHTYDVVPADAVTSDDGTSETPPDPFPGPTPETSPNA